MDDLWIKNRLRLGSHGIRLGHRGVQGVLPVSIKSKLSTPKTEGCPGECRRVLTKAENLSPF
jgi:hypothetical protein